MKRRIQFGKLAVCLAIPLAVGGLSAFLTKDGMKLFAQVKQPPLSPPAWVFPVVWTLLYLMMGAASYLVLTAEVSESRRDRALTVYGLGLAANFLWPILFFTGKAYLLAFLLLVVLWILTAAGRLLFSAIDHRAGKLLLPVLLWLSFAAYLNAGVWFLNR